MDKQFETERFELVNSDRVQVTNFPYGHSETGKLDVWIERNNKGTRFLRQIIVTQGNTGAIFPGIYTKQCHILREKMSGHYHFLDMNDNGIWLFNESFNGSENFTITETPKIQQWLTSAL